MAVEELARMAVMHAELWVRLAVARAMETTANGQDAAHVTAQANGHRDSTLELISTRAWAPIHPRALTEAKQ